MMVLTLTVIMIIAVSMCWTPGAVQVSLLYILMLKSYRNPTRWVVLPFHFTDGKTEAQKVVQGHSGSKRQTKDSDLDYSDGSFEKASRVGSWRYLACL